MNKIERLDAVLEGRQPDRPPVSFWYHFDEACASGDAAVEAHVRHMEIYDLDFLKIMDDNRYPRIGLQNGVISKTADLEKLPLLDGSEDRFALQLELIEALVQRYRGEFRMITTVFNPWTVLRQMTSPESGQHMPPVIGRSGDSRDMALSSFLREAPEALAQALNTITRSSISFIGKCLDAGVDGIFFSVRDDWVDVPVNGEGVYDRLVKPCDLEILGAVRNGAFNILHVCGEPVNFRRFGDYPVQAVNWADRYGGPSIASTTGWMKPAICAGLDNLGTLASGSPDDCEKEAADALQQAGNRPIILAPGCTFAPESVPAENLHAIRQFVEKIASNV
ncbi:MAG: uroporphyrinogen decarboxylase family protein [Acidobacteriota bacterium]